jgi:hypothetical protein
VTFFDVAANGEKLVLYASLGAMLGFILLLTAVGVRLWTVHARRFRTSRNFRFGACPCSTSGALQMPPGSSTIPLAASASPSRTTNDGRGSSAAYGSQSPLPEEVVWSDEVNLADRWRRHPSPSTAGRYDRGKVKDRCDTGCAALLATRTSTTMPRPVLKLDED